MLATVTAAWTLASESSDDNFASFVVEPWVWAAFIAFVSVLLIADLLLVHRTAHVISTKEAAIESAIWISHRRRLHRRRGVGAWGGQAAGEYISGYLIEKSLSVDNVFVWALIMSYFAVPREYQFRVLFWGVFGALVLRFVFIFAGAALLEQFEWMLFVFGGFLIFTAIRLLRHDDEEIHPENNPVLKLVRRVVPSTSEYHGQAMFIREAGKRLATPLFTVLDRDRDERRDLRRRLDPRHPRGEPRAVHPLQLERLRDPRSAGALLPARRPARQVRLPADGPGGHPRLRRLQDDHQRVVPHPHVRSRCW